MLGGSTEVVVYHWLEKQTAGMEEGAHHIEQMNMGATGQAIYQI